MLLERLASMFVAVRPARVSLVLLLLTGLPACDGPTAPAPPPLSIATTALPAATRGEAYAEAVHAEGGDGAYEWEITAGALPAGLALSVDDLSIDDAIITGIPERVETAIFTLTLRSGDGQTAARQFSLVVQPEPVPLAIMTRRLPPALVGGPYNVQILAIGGDGPAHEWRLVDGRLPTGLTLTQDGRIQGTPAQVETSTFTAEVRSGAVTVQWTFTVRVVVHDMNAFRITMFPVADIPAGVQPHVDAAVAHWETAITGNLPAVAVPQSFFSPGGCDGFGIKVNGTSTDDVIIMINITEIDGPGRVLGRAGPCGVRQVSTLPFVGILTLDVDDLMPLIGTETLTDIIAHEIAHVLGFGSLWGELGLIEDAGGADPRFTGARATAEYQALGGIGAVPLETQGGQGTRDGHWRKSTFNIELMTGFVEPVGVAQPTSRVTIAQWEDMGYTVNMAAADAFTLTGFSLRADGHDHGALGHDEVYRGAVYVLGMDGRASLLRPRLR
jgi:hypothetical protein